MSKLNTDSGFTRAQEFIYNAGYNADRDCKNPHEKVRAHVHRDEHKIQLWSAGHFDKWGRV